MQTFNASQANTVYLDVNARVSDDPIVSGTVNFYLVAKDGDNAGYWFKASDSSWSATEASAGVATYKGGSVWQLEIAAAAWDSGVSYNLYAKESGALSIIYTELVIPAYIAYLYESGAGGTCPVDLTEIKTQLYVDSSDEDDIISQYMLAATDFAENFQQRTYISRTRYLYLDSFETIIRPPYSPLVSVTSIQYYDTDGVLQTLSSSYYRVDTDSQPGRITEAYSYSWPSIRDMTGAIIVTYVSGYGEASDVPEDIKAAIKMLVQYHYGRGSEPGLFEQAKKLLWMKKIVNV